MRFPFFGRNSESKVTDDSGVQWKLGMDYFVGRPISLMYFDVARERWYLAEKRAGAILATLPGDWIFIFDGVSKEERLQALIELEKAE